MRNRNKVSKSPIPKPPAVVRSPVPVVKQVPVEKGPHLWVQVAQGLGDIFWVYQKLSPYFEKINFNISVIGKDSIQKRSEDWLRLLPKCGKVNLKIVTSENYDRMISGRYKVQDVINRFNAGEREIEYCCNRPLEEGVRLEDIDPLPPEWGVPLVYPALPVPFREYVTLYVSGTTKSPIAARDYGIWSVDQWVELLNLVYKKKNLSLPVVLIGAEFDRDTTEEVQKKLTAQGYEVTSCIGKKPERVCNILKRSEFFIGYQSGLNIIADNLKVPQIMVYFPKLYKMLNTWCRKEHIGTIFHAGIFSEGPAGIAERLP